MTTGKGRSTSRWSRAAVRHRTRLLQQYLSKQTLWRRDFRPLPRRSASGRRPAGASPIALVGLDIDRKRDSARKVQ
jgi:hypothetical protein